MASSTPNADSYREWKRQERAAREHGNSEQGLAAQRAIAEAARKGGK